MTTEKPTVLVGEIVPAPSRELVQAADAALLPPGVANPAALYLEQFGPNARRALHDSLQVLAELLTGTEPAPDARCGELRSSTSQLYRRRGYSGARCTAVTAILPRRPSDG